MKQFYSKLFTFFVLLFLLIGSRANAQFNTGTITLDGTANESAYVTSGAYSMAWDNTYLYVRYTGGGVTEPVILNLDVNPISPVDGGSNTNGSLIGQGNWGITPTLPFRADYMIYWENQYAEYRTANGSGGWSTNTAITTADRSNNATVDREIRLSWASMGLAGRPTSFNFLAFSNSRATPGFIFNQIPSENPGGTLATPTENYYYTVSSTANDGNITSPFARKSYETRTSSSITTNTFWDVTNSVTLTITGSNTVQVNGTLYNSNTVTPTGTLQFNAGSTYSHNLTSGGAVPTATWNATSLCKIAASGSSTLPTGLGQNFGNFEWANSTQGAGNIQMSAAMTSIQGSFTVSNTGTGSLRYNASSPATPTFAIGGNLIVSGGKFDTNSGTSTPTFNIAGNVLISTPGILQSSGGGLATFNLIKSAGGTQTFTSYSGGIGSQFTWNIGNATTTNTVQLLSNVPLGSSSNFNVLNNAKVDFQGFVLSGASAIFNANSGSTVITTNTSGVNGSVTTSGTNVYNAGANYIFNGATPTPAAQVTGAAVTAANNVTINNTAGVSLSSNTAITGTLTFTAGKLTTNTKTLTLSNNASGASTSAYVVTDATGTVTMNAVTTAKTLPIGTATSYTPLTLAVGSSTAYTAYVRSTTGITCGISNSSKALNVAWVLSAPTVPTSATFQWNPASDEGASFTANGACEIGRIATPSTACPYTVTAIGTAANTIPNTVAATTGFATGTNTYVIGNTNAISLSAPTVATTVAASAITDTTASSGGQTITGAALSAKGVVYSKASTTTTPTLASNDGVVTDGATTTADFASALSSLLPETQYYIRAYATNASGTAYAGAINFRTLSSPVTAQASSYTVTATSSSNIDLAWTAATFPGSGATASGYLVLRASGANTPSLSNANGNAPTAGANTTLIATLANTATTYSDGSLLSSTAYTYLLVPFTWDGTNAATYNYLNTLGVQSATTQSGPPSIATTTAASAITATSANSGGSTIVDGGSTVSAKGVVWDTNTAPTVSLSTKTNEGDTTTADFTSALTPLNPQTLYYARAYATNNSSTAYANEITFMTLSAPVAMQSASASASVSGSGSVNVSWAAAGFPTSDATQGGYVLVYSTNGTQALTSANGTVPAGTNFIVITPTTLSSAQPDTSTTVTGLTGGLTYSFTVIPFTYDGTNAATYNYLTPSAPTASVVAITNPTITTTAVTSISDVAAFSGGDTISSGGGTISAKGIVYSTNGTSASPTLAINDGIITDGATTTANFASNLTGLSTQTQYYVRAYVTNEVGTAYGSPIAFYTYATAPTVQATAMTATATSATNINLAWTGATFPDGTTTGYVLIRASGANTPSLSNGNGAAPAAGANTTIVSSSIAGAATTFTNSGVTAATTYNYRLIPFTWDGANAGTYNYLTSGTIANASATTLAAAPTAQPTVMTFSAVTSTTITTSWTAATGSPAGYIVVRGAGVTPTTDPVSGTTYTAGNTLGNGTVVFVGSAVTTGAQTGLTDGVTYNYKIYSYNGSGASINYLLTSPLSGSQATLAIAAPTATAATTITGTSFQANWGAVTGAASYQLDVLSLSISENFALFTTASGGTDRSATLNTYTQTPGWTGTSVFEDAGRIKLGSGSALGSIITPTLDLSGNGGNSTLTFDLGTFGSDATIVQVFLSTNNGSSYAQIGADITAPASVTTQTISITGGNSTSKIKIAAKVASNNRYYLDNFTLFNTFVSGYSNLSVAGTSQTVSGLSGNTTYAYRVRTVGTNSTSANSNVIIAATLNDITTADFRYKASTTGNWSTTANWEYNSTGSTWVAAGQLPASTNNVNIQSTSVVTLDQAFTIGTGKTVTVNGTLNTGTNIIDGAGTFTLVAASNLRVGSADGISASGATGNIQTTTRNFVGSANYQYNGAANQVTGTGLPSTVTTALVINSGANTVSLTTTGTTVSGLTLTSGTFAPGSGNTINIAAASTVSSAGGAIASGANGGKVNFVGAGTINGATAITFNDVTINTGTLTLTTVPTFGGTFQINNGNVSAAPIYGASSTLVYNTTYGRFNEWTAGAGTIGVTAGYPNNVTIQNGATVSWGNPGAEIGLAGNLNLGVTGSAGSLTIQNGNKIAVAGNVTIGSNTGTSTLTLSTNSGGDIRVGGNWTRTANGVFIPNTRAVFFTGAGTNVITSSGGAAFDYLVSQKTGGSIQLASNFTANAPSGGNSLSLKTAATFDLNGNTLNLTNATSSNVQADGGVVSFIGTGTINFTSSTKTFTQINSGSFSFGSNVALTTSTGVDFGTISTVNGSFQINAGGFVQTNAPIYATGSTLIYNSGTSYGRSNEWSTGSTGQGVPYNVTVNTGTTVNFSVSTTATDARTVRGDLTLNGSFNFGGDTGTVGDLTINGNLFIAGGTLTMGKYDGVNGSDINLYGNWTRTSGSFNSNNRAIFLLGTANANISENTSSTFSYLFVNKTAGAKVTLSNDLTVSTNLTFTSGNIETGSNKVIITAGDGITRTSGHVVGNLQMNIPTGASSRTFVVGDATNYTPITLAHTGVTAAGNIIGNTIGTDHPQVTDVTSGLNAAKTANRYYSFSTNGVTGGTYDATFNFVAGDLDAGANTSNFVVRRYASSVWNTTSVGTRTSTSTQATGISAGSYGDFQLGELAQVSISSQPSNSSICNDGSTSFNVISTNGTVYQWQRSTDNGSTWADITSTSFDSGVTYANYDTDTLGLSNASTSVSLYQYRVVVTRPSYLSVTSNAVILTVNDSTAITSHPTNRTVCVDTTPSPLSVSAIGGSLSYQWYSNVDNNNTTGSLISGATSSSYDPSTASAGTTYYYAIVTGACGSATSNTSTVVVNDYSTNTTEITACDSYTWPVNGVTYYDSDIFSETVGCVTETLELTINNSTSNSESITACDSYMWPINETTYTESGTYTSTSTNESGCTHTETLVLTINQSTSHTTTATACNTYTWSAPLGNGQTYTTSQTGLTNVSTNAAGCTHTETLNLTINNTTAHTTTATACDSYVWSGPLGNDTTYTTSGTYTNVTTNAAGCDHTETLALTINHSTSSSESVTACDSYTWSVNETEYTESGTYTVTGTNAEGCTDTKTLVLTIYNSTPSSQTVTACDTYTWSVNGETYTTSGTYVFEGVNEAGCPQNQTLYLTINHSTSSTESVTACDTYTWSVNGQTYTTSGTRTYSSTNAAGCTDTKTLVLTINNSTASSQTVSACDTYTWSVDGETYTESGTYTYASTNAAGCPDTKTLVLTITPSTAHTTTVSTCDTYTWTAGDGETYTESGTHTYVNGCHTETLELTITPSTSNTTTATACDTYTWSVNGQAYTTSGVRTIVTGCHTETLDLTINNSTSSSQSVTACDTYTWSVNGQAYTASGTYTYTSTNAAGCIDTKTLNLTINNSTSSTQTVAACGSYTWSVNGQTYTSSGTYTNVGTNASGCTDTKTLVLTVSGTNTSNATSTWTNGQNDNTTGFGAWNLSTVGGTAGFFSGSSDINNGGSYSWGMYAAGGTNVANAVRSVAMGVGNTLSFSMDNGFIDNGKTVGFGLQNSAGQNLAELVFIGGESTYKMIDNSSTPTSVGYTGTGLDISLTYTGLNSYSITVTPRGGSSATYSRTFATQAGGQKPAQIRFFNAGAGSGGSYDLFFNSLAINNPVITTQPSNSVQNICSGSASTNLTVAASGSGQTYQWYSSTSNTTYAGATNLGAGAQTATVTPQNTTAGTLYYYCIVTDPCGTTYSDFSGAVNVTSPSNAGKLSGTQEVCVNGLTTFSTNGTTGGSWSSSDTAIATVNASGVITGVSAGSATITYTVNGTGGCSNATATKDVTVNSLPTVEITNNTGSSVITCSTTSVSVTATGGDTYSWSNGTSVVGTSADLTITAGGTYTVTATNSFGCTATASIAITENRTTTSSETATACDTYTWALNGETYTTSGNYNYVSTNETGCVNTATLHLTINNSTSHTTTATACNTYTWEAPLGDGQTYTTSQTGLTNTSINTAGCTHTETLNLIINSSTAHTTVTSACDTYTWEAPLGNGQTYTTSQSGLTYTSTNAAGCSHIETLNLTINNSTSHTTTVTSCDSYTWAAPLGNGTTYTTGGTYTNVSTNASGCDHTETLVLTINNSTSSVQTVTSETCGTYTWSVNGVTYTSSGTYTYTSTNAAGCTDTKTLVLTITPCPSSEVTVKMNIEGYYDAEANAMRPVMANQGIGSSTTDVGSVTVELHDATTYALVATATATLQTNGNAVATFSPAQSGSFYIVVRHRNALETWSAAPQTVGASSTYDFTDSASKAYSSNMIEVEPGVFAFYSGDLNQDLSIDSSDGDDLANDSYNSAYGDLATDLNGDGAVDSSDLDYFYNNSYNSVYTRNPMQP